MYIIYDKGLSHDKPFLVSKKNSLLSPRAESRGYE